MTSRGKPAFSMVICQYKNTCLILVIYSRKIVFNCVLTRLSLGAQIRNIFLYILSKIQTYLNHIFKACISIIIHIPFPSTAIQKG